MQFYATEAMSILKILKVAKKAVWWEIDLTNLHSIQCEGAIAYKVSWNSVYLFLNYTHPGMSVTHTETDFKK